LSIITFYSLKKIINRTGGSSKRMLLAFRAHVSSGLPKSKNDPLYRYYQMDFSGNSFMLNPHELIKYAFKYTPKEVAQYIGLASFRNYSYYRVTGDRSLDLFHSPVDQDTINQNRLLRIVDGRVHFYYEEDAKRRNRIWH